MLLDLIVGGLDFPDWGRQSVEPIVPDEDDSETPTPKGEGKVQGNRASSTMAEPKVSPANGGTPTQKIVQSFEAFRPLSER